jgi:hypothetical protein
MDPTEFALRERVRECSERMQWRFLIAGAAAGGAMGAMRRSLMWPFALVPLGFAADLYDDYVRCAPCVHDLQEFLLASRIKSASSRPT